MLNKASLLNIGKKIPFHIRIYLKSDDGNSNVATTALYARVQRGDGVSYIKLVDVAFSVSDGAFIEQVIPDVSPLKSSDGNVWVGMVPTVKDAIDSTSGNEVYSEDGTAIVDYGFAESIQFRFSDDTFNESIFDPLKNAPFYKMSAKPYEFRPEADVCIVYPAGVYYWYRYAAD